MGDTMPEPTKPCSYRLPADLHRAVKILAAQEGCTTSDIARRALEREVNS